MPRKIPKKTRRNASVPAPRRAKAVSAPLPRLSWEEAGLTIGQHTFCLAYLENGFNARVAYRTAHPDCTLGTADVEGHRTLNLPKVRRYMSERLERAWADLVIGGDQALGRVALAATLDAADLFDERDQLKPVSEWPLNARVALRSVQDGPYGRKVSFVDPHAALRTILEQTGKLKSVGGGLDALADALKRDLERRAKRDGV